MGEGDKENFKHNQESWQFYKDIIRPDQINVVVGPGLRPDLDPSLMLVASLVGDGSGKILVVDPKTSNHPENSTNRPSFETVGAGNINSHLDYLKMIKQLGIDLKDPEPLGPDSYAQHIQLPDNSVDVLVDHGTGAFIICSQPGKSIELKKQQLTELFQEYTRVLKPGGKIIFQVDNGIYDFENSVFLSQFNINILELMEKANLVTTHHRVNDKFQFNISNRIFDNIISERSSGNFDKIRTWLLSASAIKKHDQFILSFKPSVHSCPDLYLGVKK
jgi:hypothetical protein